MPPPWVRDWAWASCRFFLFIVFSLCLPFGFSSYIVHLRCTSEGWWSRCFTRSLILSLFVSVCCPAVFLSAQMGCIVYTYYVYPAFDPLIADISCLLFLFRKWFFCLFVFVCLLFLFFFSFPPCVLSFLLAISYPLDSLPDLGSPFAFVFLSAFVHIPILCDR